MVNARRNEQGSFSGGDRERIGMRWDVPKWGGVSSCIIVRSSDAAELGCDLARRKRVFRAAARSARPIQGCIQQWDGARRRASGTCGDFYADQ